jgi:LuxR family transcriptional regulator, maltose regulon positive regulatory protein
VHMDLDLIESLTSRETAVMWLLDARLSNKEIAASLGIASGTVQRHTRTIYRKLTIGTRRAAATRTHGLRLLSSPLPEGVSPP